jgi:exodeoxyribonuclease VII small subunit
MAKAEKKAEKFEDLLDKAEAIVSELEGGELDLAKSIDRYQEGLKALKKCYELLKSVEGKIQVLRLDDGGNVKLEPFQSEGSGKDD